VWRRAKEKTERVVKHKEARVGVPKPARKSLNGRLGWFTRAMDPQSQAFTPYSSNNETWRLQSDIVRFQQVQAEHAERIARLERRQEDDARMKSVWGQTSPFPSVLSGTPQQGEIQFCLLGLHKGLT
jgi:hypothetical protein